jgi:hypothetical protein
MAWPMLSPASSISPLPSPLVICSLLFPSFTTKLLPSLQHAQSLKVPSPSLAAKHGKHELWEWWGNGVFKRKYALLNPSILHTNKQGRSINACLQKNYSKHKHTRSCWCTSCSLLYSANKQTKNSMWECTFLVYSFLFANDQTIKESVMLKFLNPSIS